MRVLHALVTLAAVTAAATSFAATDTNLGKTLHDKQCTSCHVKQFGGDGSRMYTRTDHKIKNAAALKQRVAGCAAQTGAKWLPDEEEAVVAYLAQQFYKFK